MASSEVHGSFDVSQVSGFYGPGAWAGGLIAIFTTWYTTLFHVEKLLTPSTFAPILTINWAAVDLIVQIRAKELAVYSATAAYTTTSWGLLHMVLQYEVVGFLNRSSTKRLPQMLLVFGCVVPVIALLRCAYRPIYVQDLPKIGWPLFLVHGLALLALLYMLGLYLNMSILDRNRDEPRSSQSFAAYLARSARMVAPVFVVVSSLLTPFMWFQGLNARASCFIKPCAPQSVKEWDQAFALLSGLMLFVYEVGPDIANLARERSGGSIGQFLHRGARYLSSTP
ncbi:hypothetical protein BKA63DRAFT_230658 [Paraphoma chrysanthemicola]|nr:hypothetical protein BKA63DRAFT_230658 [Paraphoma chrysanthemicola]